MNLVFFNDAIYHVTKICRVLKTPRANKLLIFVGGSRRGKILYLGILTRLAACIKGLSTFSI